MLLCVPLSTAVACTARFECAQKVHVTRGINIALTRTLSRCARPLRSGRAARDKALVSASINILLRTRNLMGPEKDV